MKNYLMHFVEIDRHGLRSKSQVLDYIWKAAKNILLESGCVYPVLAIVKPTKILLGTVGKMFADDEAKEDFAKFVKGLTSQPDVQGYILLAEIWYYISKKGFSLRPSEHSDKKEALFLQSEWVDGEEIRRGVRICRSGDQISLEEDLDLGPALAGRFYNLMSKKAKQ